MPPKTYSASCHCGDITYTVTLSEPLAPEGEGKMLICNCSICTKNGYLLVYPLRSDVVWSPGSEEKLKDCLAPLETTTSPLHSGPLADMKADYMGKKNKAHRFCPSCSSSILIDFRNSDVENQRTYLALNARLFEGVDLSRASFHYYDGWEGIEPKYGRDVAKRATGDEGRGEK